MTTYLLDTDLELARSVARRAGEYRYEFRRRGQTLATTDTLIGATAAEYQAILLTRNQRHYPMADIQTAVPPL